MSSACMNLACSQDDQMNLEAAATTILQCRGTDWTNATSEIQVPLVVSSERLMAVQWQAAVKYVSTQHTDSQNEEVRTFVCGYSAAVAARFTGVCRQFLRY